MEAPAARQQKERVVLAQVLSIAVLVVAAVATLGAVFFLGMRAKWPLVQRPVVWFSRRVVNPRQLRSAGAPGAYASVIRTVGRRSGRAYQTPVGVVAAGDDFVIALPYGTRPNWLQNVLAAGSATIVHDGQTHAVDRPELVPMNEVEACFAPADQRSHRLFHVDQCVRLRRAADAAAGLAATA